MQVLRFWSGVRTISCVGLVGFLALASGCGDSNPVTAVGAEEGKKIAEAQLNAQPGGLRQGRHPRHPGGQTEERPCKKVSVAEAVRCSAVRITRSGR